MTFCGHRAVLLVTQDVVDTSTSVARERTELRCDLEQGHDGPHRDSSQGEVWEGQTSRLVTLLRHFTEGTPSTRTAVSSAVAQTEAVEETFDCLECGACCFQRPGTILVEASDLVRWRKLGREDVLEQLEPGHFGQMAFKMNAQGCCVHHGTPDAPHACRIYDVRSETCIRFEAGSKQCLEFRRERLHR